MHKHLSFVVTACLENALTNVVAVVAGLITDGINYNPSP